MSPNYGTKPDQDAENASMLTDDYPTTNYVIAAPLEAPLRYVGRCLYSIGPDILTARSEF